MAPHFPANSNTNRYQLLIVSRKPNQCTQHNHTGADSYNTNEVISLPISKSANTLSQVRMDKQRTAASQQTLQLTTNYPIAITHNRKIITHVTISFYQSEWTTNDKNTNRSQLCTTSPQYVLRSNLLTAAYYHPEANRQHTCAALVLL